MNSTKDGWKIRTKEERLALKNRNLHREITHEDYTVKNSNKVEEGKGGFYRKILFAKPKNMRFRETKDELYVRYKERYRIDDQYWESTTGAYGSPKTYGGGSLLITLGLSISFIYGSERIYWYYAIIWLVAFSLSILYIAYYIWMPKDKEHILDRQKGTMTFPGYFWQKNVTMAFEKLLMFKPGPGTNAIAAQGIKVINPQKYCGTFFFSMGLGNYDDMTLLTWYMDRNRPLPPTDQFKPYREKDFERRKVEGFPPPLYSSFFNTPEDTPEQQKEREQYWREDIFTDDNGDLITQIVRGNDEFFDMETRQWVKVE